MEIVIFLEETAGGGGGKLELSRLWGGGAANVTSHSTYRFMHVKSQWKLERRWRCVHLALNFDGTVCKFVRQFIIYPNYHVSWEHIKRDC